MESLKSVLPLGFNKAKDAFALLPYSVLPHILLPFPLSILRLLSLPPTFANYSLIFMSLSATVSMVKITKVSLYFPDSKSNTLTQKFEKYQGEKK